jgi:hypothetical protein
MRFGDKCRFRNTKMLRKTGKMVEPWWYYGTFHSFVAGGYSADAVDSDGGDKIFCCRKPSGRLERFQFCETVFD